MSGALLEVICLHAADARRAEEGGADRVELLGSLDDGGMSPESGLHAVPRRFSVLAT